MFIPINMDSANQDTKLPVTTGIDLSSAPATTPETPIISETQTDGDRPVTPTGDMPLRDWMRLQRWTFDSGAASFDERVAIEGLPTPSPSLSPRSTTPKLESTDLSLDNTGASTTDDLSSTPSISLRGGDMFHLHSLSFDYDSSRFYDGVASQPESPPMSTTPSLVWEDTSQDIFSTFSTFTEPLPVDDWMRLHSWNFAKGEACFDAKVTGESRHPESPPLSPKSLPQKQGLEDTSLAETNICKSAFLP